MWKCEHVGIRYNYIYIYIYGVYIYKYIYIYIYMYIYIYIYAPPPPQNKPAPAVQVSLDRYYPKWAHFIAFAALRSEQIVCGIRPLDLFPTISYIYIYILWS